MLPSIRLIACVICLTLVLSAGCIEITREERHTNSADKEPGAVERGAEFVREFEHPARITEPASEESRRVDDLVVVRVDPVPVQPGESIPSDNPLNIGQPTMHRPPSHTDSTKRDILYEETIRLNYSVVGLGVPVDVVPFFIECDITPLYGNPDTASLVMTVRDARTNELVADTGYNWIYSSNREKRIVLYTPGEYVVTMDGRRVKVTLTMGTERSESG